MKKITLTSLHCAHQITSPGNDDVFILLQLDGGAPIRHPVIGTYEMPKVETETFSPAPEYYFEKNAYISLWDRDGLANFINAADMCGTFNIGKSISDGDHEYWTVGDHNAQYRLNFSIETVDSAPVQHPVLSVTEDVSSALVSLQTEIESALDAWDDMSELLGMTETSDLNDALSDAVSGGVLGNVISFLSDPSIVALLPVKAVSLGIMGQAEIFAGISGNFGCASSLANFNPENFDDNYTIFAGGGIAEGADAGLEVAIAVGIWFQDVTEIGGFYVGAEADEADGAGGTCVAYAASDDEEDFKGGDRLNLDFAKVMFMGVDVGVDAGVEAEETYFFAGHLESAQVSQTGDFDHQALVTWVSCLKMDKDDKDEVHFHFYADGDSTQYRYPIWNDVQMTDEHSGNPKKPSEIYSSQTDSNMLKTYRNTGQMIQFNEYFEVSLHLNGSDLGSKKVHWSNFDGGSVEAALGWTDSDGKYHYVLKFDIVT